MRRPSQQQAVSGIDDQFDIGTLCRQIAGMMPVNATEPGVPAKTSSSHRNAGRPYPIGAMVHAVTVIRVTATARETGGGQFQRVAVVRVAPAEPDDAFTYRILSWE
jgi:hypothetical protein